MLVPVSREDEAQAWHDEHCPPEEGDCYCCCWRCSEENPIVKEAGYDYPPDVVSGPEPTEGG